MRGGGASQAGLDVIENALNALRHLGDRQPLVDAGRRHPAEQSEGMPSGIAGVPTVI